MGIWAEIKYALNSTLGTANFKPLDKIIRDSYYVYASDDLLKVLYEETSRAVYADLPLTDVGVINVSGVIKIKAEVSGNWLGTHLIIGVKGDLIDITLPTAQTYPPEAPYVVEREIEVKKGDTLQLQVDLFQDRSDYLNSIKLTANGKIGSAPDTGIFIE